VRQSKEALDDITARLRAAETETEETRARLKTAESRANAADVALAKHKTQQGTQPPATKTIETNASAGQDGDKRKEEEEAHTARRLKAAEERADAAERALAEYKRSPSSNGALSKEVSVGASTDAAPASSASVSEAGASDERMTGLSKKLEESQSEVSLIMSLEPVKCIQPQPQPQPQPAQSAPFFCLFFPRAHARARARTHTHTHTSRSSNFDAISPSSSPPGQRPNRCNQRDSKTSSRMRGQRWVSPACLVCLPCMVRVWGREGGGGGGRKKKCLPHTFSDVSSHHRYFNCCDHHHCNHHHTSIAWHERPLICAHTCQHSHVPLLYARWLSGRRGMLSLKRSWSN
jgi:hypothetical protein